MELRRLHIDKRVNLSGLVGKIKQIVIAEVAARVNPVCQL